MNVFSYVKTLAGSFGKNAVITEIATVRDELNNVVLPFFKTNLSFLQNSETTIQSGTYKRDRDTFIRAIVDAGYLRGNSLFVMQNKILLNCLEILNWIEGYFSKDKSVEINRDSIDLSKATALQMLAAINFCSRYTRAWLELIISAETNARSMLGDEVGMTPLQIKYLNENRDAFARIMGILSTPIRDIEKAIAAIPDIIVSESNPSVVAAVSGTKADPFKFNLIQSKWDIFYLFGMISTDYSVYRYKATKEEAALLQMKIHRLKAKLEMKDDPRLASIIEKNQAELDKLRGKLRKKEEELL